MPLKKFLNHKTRIQIKDLIPVLWIGFQLKAYYWILIVVLFLALCRMHDTLFNFFSSFRQLLMSALLLVFSLSLLASAALDAGLTGMLSELPVTLPILPIYILSSVAFERRNAGIAAGSRYIVYSYCVGILLILEALFHGYNLSDSPISSLRPFEIQASSAIFFLTALGISNSLRGLSGLFQANLSRLLFLSVSILSFATFVCFRGATSACALFINSIVVLLTCILPAMRGFTPFLLGLPFACFALALTAVLDLRFLFLKYLIAPFSAENLANGRLSLMHTWIADYGREPLRVIGSQARVPMDFFAHNLIVDSMIKDGLIPAAACFLFFSLGIFFLVSDISRRFDKYRFLNLLLLLLMTIPALLQPVQFSHAFAFLLSISTVSVLVSVPINQPPEVLHNPVRT